MSLIGLTHINSTQHSTSIATNWANCKEDIANRIHERNRRRIKDALADGCDYLRLSKILRGDTFKKELESIGKSAAEAMKYAKLYQVFAGFSIESLARVSLPTLFALCQKRYQQLVVKLRSLPPQTEVQIQQLMAQKREQQKADKPKRERSGLINLPSGGRAFQFPLLHDDEVIAKVLRLLEYREDLTPVQLLGEAIALLFEQEDRVQRRKQHLYKDYHQGAQRLKDWQHNARVLQRAKDEGMIT